MKPILVISAILAVSTARPEPPSGYSYPVPSGPTLSLPGPSIGGSHGISSISGGSHGSDISHISLTTSGGGGGSYESSHGSSLGSLGGHGSSLGSLGGHGSSIGSLGGHGSSLGSLGGHGSSFGSSSSFASGGSHGSFLSGGSLGGSSLLSGGSSLGSLGGHGASFGSSSSSAFSGSSGFGSSASLGNFGGGSTLVQKHIYVHVPPPEHEDLRPQRIIPVAPAQKHYKIIFIKAPSPPAPTVPAIPIQPQNEEKTLVYVLVKKPDEAPELSIPAPVPTQPSKPEVYFIRYKTQKDHSGGGSFSGSSFSGGSLGSHGSIDDSSLALAGSSGLSGGSLESHGSLSSLSGGLSSFSGSHGSASSSASSSFVSGSSSGGLSTSYGPPGHVPGPY